jgi:uncharacterized protein (DUF1697 family)
MMSVQIALLRGINVGGNRLLPMVELRAVLEGLGARDVRTYIQSGNAAYRGDLDGDDVADAIFATNGFRPDVLVIPLDSYAACLATNPFPEAESDPKVLHLFFLASPSLIDEANLHVAKGLRERFVLTERVFYLHTPDYLSGSTIAPKLEKLLDVAATARNWRSAGKILEMAQGLARGH